MANETNHYGFGFADPDGHKFMYYGWKKECEKMLSCRKNLFQTSI